MGSTTSSQEGDVRAAERPDLADPVVAYLRHPVRVADLAPADGHQVEIAAPEPPDQVLDPAIAGRPGFLALEGVHDADAEADAADGDHRRAGEGLHPAGQAEIGALPLRRPEPAGRHVE